MESDESDTEEEYIAFVAPPAYDEASQEKILNWKPEPWWIPERKELEQVKDFLCIPKGTSELDRSGREYREQKYFSATTAAVCFLKQLSPEIRQNVREVVIQEDHLSVLLPASHAQGLNPLFRKNPRLVVKKRVDLWRTTLVLNSNRVFRSAKHDLQGIMRWVHEARVLRQRGMPANSFELVLHGPSPEASQHIHNVVVNAAILQEAAREIGRQNNMENAFTCHPVSVDFPDVIKQILRGEIPVRFEAEMGQPWDLEVILREHRGEWADDFKQGFAIEDLEEPPEGWDAARRAYIEFVDWTERMDGFDLLVETA
ncbi:hypothetical protein CC86DRAFT_410645 [Ophiobolus disseminans]|uniref:Uncharacterized protein n=1 Tax=Ophiobolus disseminans TaxID=1469910 RepID=A0A6A6ZNB3_9PLEO|nr:hypothetical protein CC86DRAFT_410645 [Ophiobolus disseminans]